MARGTNYGFKKRQRELAKQKKKEAKRLLKEAAKRDADEAAAGTEAEQGQPKEPSGDEPPRVESRGRAQTR